MSSISASVSSASPFQSQSASRKPNCNKVGHDAASCWSSGAKAAGAGGGGARNTPKRGRQSGNRRTKQKTPYKRTTGGTPNAANTAKRAPPQFGSPANSNVQCFEALINCGGFGHIRYATVLLDPANHQENLSPRTL